MYNIYITIYYLMNNTNKNYDILIVSEDYPGYGGFGTYAFNLYNQMNQNVYNVGLLYFTRMNDKSKMNTPMNNNIYSIYIPNFFCSVNMIIEEAYHSKILEKNIIDALIKHGINKVKLVISISPTSLALTNKFIEADVHIYRMGHIHFKKIEDVTDLWNTSQKNIDTIMVPNYIADKILKRDNKILVIPNSPLSEIYIRQVKTKLQLKNKICSNMVGLSYNINNGFTGKKKYDIIFVTSDVSRNVKNFTLVQKIFEKFDVNHKILIGHNVKHHNFKNTTVHEYLPNASLLKLLAETKILLLPSYVDAGPNVVLESLMCKTIPIMALNTGFSSLFSDKYVCKTMELEEWCMQIKNVLDTYNKIVYDKEFSNILHKFDNDKIKFWDLVNSSMIESAIINYAHPSSDTDSISLKLLTYDENPVPSSISITNIDNDTLHNITADEKDLAILKNR